MAKSRTCHWCACEIFPAKDVGDTHPAARTLDHVKCKAECSSRGEYVNQTNKVWACHACNQRRNDEYMAANPIPPKFGWWVEVRNRNLALAAHRKNFVDACQNSKGFLPPRTGHTYY